MSITYLVDEEIEQQPIFIDEMERRRLADFSRTQTRGYGVIESSYMLFIHKSPIVRRPEESESEFRQKRLNAFILREARNDHIHIGQNYQLAPLRKREPRVITQTPSYIMP